MKTLVLLMFLLPFAAMAQSIERASPVPEKEINEKFEEQPVPDNYEHILMLAEQAALNKQYGKAIRLLNECIKQNDTCAFLFSKLAILHLQNEQYVKSLKAACRAAELNPHEPRNFNIMGITLSYLGNYEQALNAYTRAITLDSSFAVAYYNRGLLRYEIRDKNGAYTDLYKAKELKLEGVDEIIGELLASRSFR